MAIVSQKEIVKLSRRHRVRRSLVSLVVTVIALVPLEGAMTRPAAAAATGSPGAAVPYTVQTDVSNDGHVYGLFTNNTKVLEAGVPVQGGPPCGGDWLVSTTNNTDFVLHLTTGTSTPRGKRVDLAARTDFLFPGQTAQFCVPFAAHQEFDVTYSMNDWFARRADIALLVAGAFGIPADNVVALENFIAAVASVPEVQRAGHCLGKKGVGAVLCIGGALKGFVHDQRSVSQLLDALNAAGVGAIPGGVSGLFELILKHITTAATSGIWVAHFIGQEITSPDGYVGFATVVSGGPGGAGWTNLNLATGPTVAGGGAMAYDRANARLVLFGNVTGSDEGSTWTWDGVTWTHHVATGPTVSRAAGMVYDDATRNVVLFGGYGLHYSSETWTWNGTMWTKHTPATSPPARESASMAYDPATGNVVLFGGIGSNGDLADTWTWNGTTWTERTPTASPSARDRASMAYDRVSGLVLFGGEAGGAALGDTWTWNGTTWTKHTPATSPPARYAAPMADNPSAGTLVLFGGNVGPPYPAPPSLANDTWLWNGAMWARQTSGSAPPAHFGGTMAYDAAIGSDIYQEPYNWVNPYQTENTWKWDG